jgi:hypothetical protein
MAAQREQRKAVYGVGTRKDLNHGQEYRFRSRVTFLWSLQTRFAGTKPALLSGGRGHKNLRPNSVLPRYFSPRN